MRLAWVCPISARTGVGSYAQSVLRALTRRKGLEVMVLHPPCAEDDRLPMPCPTLPLSDALIRSDLPDLFDLMLYHLGNNEAHHGMILRALMAHPGPVVLHDHVYQHMFAGLHHDGTAPAPGFGALIHAVSGATGFDYLATSGTLRGNTPVSYVPWESNWAAQVPLSDVLARLATGVITHSGFAARAIGDTYPGSATTLFMPRPDVPVDPPERAPGLGARLRLAATGHIGPTKGLDLLVDTLAGSPDLADRYHITIAGHAGDAPYMQMLDTRITAAQLTDTIRIVPDPDDTAFKAVMQEADLFLNLRRPNTEGASLSLAEQMASGRPVIVQNSGCFAEMPGKCGWHLPAGADASDLADTLRDILRDPRVITKRGQAAARFMTGRTAEAYADKLATFLCAGQTRLARRSDIARARVITPDAQDQDWHSSYVQVRGLMSGILAGRGLLPPDLWAYPDEDVGQYVALNLLNVPVRDPATLSRALQQGGPLRTLQRLGLLRQLLARAASQSGDTQHHISDLALPISDAALWTVLMGLPCATALPMALQALGHRPTPDAQTQLTKHAQRDGLGATLLTYLETRGDPLLKRPEMAAVHQILSDPDGRSPAHLPPLPPNADIVHIAQTPDARALRLTGFHPPEDAGLWTAQPRASLRTHASPDLPATALRGAASLFEAALTHKAMTISIKATEETTGRSTSWSDTRPQGGDPSFDWVLPLPGFTGPLRVDLSLPACHSPKALGVSADPRPLGLMLRSLRFETAAPQIEAAE
ncbi:glycosyltransferase family 4 protein [Marivita sp. S6314]|uniref:glycosyltransferase family 4 protein n=1 Tax=Marivita sp. S6314 TaxID=2926406 RepID=UPI001FF34B4A|nr:glycosyltransferase family 4 protein [Marivita sp. S6314]MCK0151969.1 glycosyltransferase family 4 protein [Marivita sp. S6314]